MPIDDYRERPRLGVCGEGSSTSLEKKAESQASSALKRRRTSGAPQTSLIVAGASRIATPIFGEAGRANGAGS